MSVIKYYMLDDSRIWDIEAGQFIESLPEGTLDDDIGYCYDSDGKSSFQGLLECLDFYGFPKGELKSDEEFAAEARTKRNQLLSETDYLVTPDYPLTEAQKQTLYSYRQALRDIPTQKGFPREITWPTLNLK